MLVMESLLVHHNITKRATAKKLHSKLATVRDGREKVVQNDRGAQHDRFRVTKPG